MLLIARPVGGLDEEITGILPAVEPVESTAFRLPTRDDLGDFASGQLLREAAHACRPVRPLVLSAASVASPSSRDPISSCR